MTAFVNRKICDAAEKNSCLVILISDRFRWSRKPAAITVRIIVCVALIRKFRDSPMKKSKKLKDEDVWAKIYREGGLPDER